MGRQRYDQLVLVDDVELVKLVKPVVTARIRLRFLQDDFQRFASNSRRDLTSATGAKRGGLAGGKWEVQMIAGFPSTQKYEFIGHMVEGRSEVVNGIAELEGKRDVEWRQLPIPQNASVEHRYSGGDVGISQWPESIEMPPSMTDL